MMFGALSRLARVWVTLTYAAILAVVSVMLSKLDPALQDRLIQDASTNLHNLSHGRIDTLVVSAFVADAGPEWQWVPGLVFLLVIGELLWRSRRLLVTLAACHVGATVLVGVWLVVAIECQWLPIDVAYEADVGMSYGAVGVLGALTPAIPRPWRSAWIGWWLGVALFIVATNTDFAYLGHLVALLLGMLVATRFGMPRPWTPIKVVLLILGVTFGFLVLTNDAPPALAAVAGLAGATVVTAGHLLLAWATQRNSSADAGIGQS